MTSRVHSSSRGAWKDDTGAPEWLAEEFESPLPHRRRHKRKEETKPRCQWLGPGLTPWGPAATPPSPWHHALRWFYSELPGCEESLGCDNSLRVNTACHDKC